MDIWVYTAIRNFDGFIAVENSMGFHNPEEALRILASATDLARQAEIKALESIRLPK